MSYIVCKRLGSKFISSSRHIFEPNWGFESSQDKPKSANQVNFISKPTSQALIIIVLYFDVKTNRPASCAFVVCTKMESCIVMGWTTCMFKAKNRMFEFDYQKMNTFKFVRCSKKSCSRLFDEKLNKSSDGSYYVRVGCLFVWGQK